MVVCCAIVSSSRAGSINYGDFATGTVIYKQVTESSTNPGVPLFGAPTPSGNALLFNPPNFSATASNGGLQFTDGTLNTNINAAPGQGINSIVVNEFGDYTLQPFSGTSSTFASVSAPVFLVIQAVNGVALTSPIHYNTNLTFTGGGTYSLPTNVGTGVIWSGSASIDVNAILAANNISGKATQIQYTMDNSLLAVSGGAGTLAFIKKKDIGGVTITTNVPEPSSIVLVGIMGTVGLIARWRRRR
ncbi:MAG: PEP-CTERM sorting domain-containing protein [Singulisphaera sp.]